MSIIDTHLGDLVELFRSASEDAFAAKVAEITDSIAAGAPTTEAQRRRLLTTVRGRRAFAPLAKLCETLTWAGHDTPVLPDGKGGAVRNPAYDPRVRQEMIQAMIDQGHLIQALDVVDQHRRRIESLGTGEGPPADPGLAYAWGQSCGLAGRIHKQIYVDNAERDTRANFEEHLRHAICWYGLPFRRVEGDRIRCDETRDDEWHAINFVAMLHRAEKDGVSIPGESAKARAAGLVEVLKGKIAALERAGKPVAAWTWASLGEAHVALGAWEAARGAYQRYAATAGVDTFQLYGSLRQLIEVWGLDGSEGEGRCQAIFDTLGLKIAEHGAEVGVSGELFAVEEFYDEQNRLVSRISIKSGARSEVLQCSNPRVVQGIGRAIRTAAAMPLLRAAQAANSVGRVIDAKTDHTVGTGFVIDGARILPELKGMPVFVTNWHVLSENNPNSAVGPSSARIRFDLASEEAHRTLELKVETILWESTQAEHDVCLSLLSPMPAWLKPLNVAMHVDFPDTLDAIAVRDRFCCVVGFAGNDRSRFIGDGHSLRLLDVGRRTTETVGPLLVHYSNHTKPGDSGGPVCNEAWQVIALHHAGAILPTKRIRSVTSGRHEGDVAEGIAMKSILAALAKDANDIRDRLQRRSSGVVEAETLTEGQALNKLRELDGIEEIDDQEALDALITRAVSFSEDDETIVSDDNGATAPMGPVVSAADVAQRGAMEGAIDSVVVLLSRLNRAARNSRFRQSIEQDLPGYRLLTDGDSWFQYPKPGVEDVIDQLINRHGYVVNCGAIAGETLQGRLAESDIDRRSDEIDADAIVLSGGGNDMLGYGAIVGYLRPFKPGMTVADLVNMNAVEKAVALLVEHHATWIGRIRDYNPSIPIFNHGYDYAVPKRKGPWLDRPLSRHGVRDAELQRQVVRLIIDRFSIGMAALAAQEKHVHFIDCRNLCRTGLYWMDELHPTNDGFARVAACFHAAIEKELGPAPK